VTTAHEAAQLPCFCLYHHDNVPSVAHDTTSTAPQPYTTTVSFLLVSACEAADEREQKC
jgi:hypothetical protein